MASRIKGLEESEENQKKTTDEFRKGYDRIFRKNKQDDYKESKRSCEDVRDI